MALNKDSFLIVNPKATTSDQSVIFITTDPSWNPLVFTITNNTTADIKLTGGTPVNGPVTNGVSSFVLDFSNMLSNSEVGAMKITDTNGQWGALFFLSKDPNVPSAWAVAPLKDLIIPAKGVVTFNFSGVTCTESNPGNFDVTWFNIPGMPDRAFPYVYHMAKMNPPGGKPLPLSCNFINVVHPIGPQTTSPADQPGNLINVDITYNNTYPIKNGYTITLTNTSTGPLEPDGTPIGAASVFISFVFATDDDDAITTQANGDNIVINIDAQETQWGTVAHVPGTATWQFLPQSANIMAKGETVNFEVTNIITALNVNPNQISVVYIQLNNIPNYADGLYTINMLKQTAVASIYPNSFAVSPAIINYGQNVVLSWITIVAWRVTLQYSDRDGNIFLLDSTKGDIPLTTPVGGFIPKTAPSAQNTTFYLTAYDSRTTPAAQANIPLTVVEPPAGISSFTAASYLVDIKSNPNTTLITWTTTNAQIVTLNGVKVKQNDSKQVTVNNTATYTLIAYPYGTQLQPVTQSITIFAYQSYAPVTVGPAGSGTTYQQLPLTLVNNNPAVNQIYACNGATVGSNNGQVYLVSQVQRALTGSPLPGNVMCLSPDITRLYVNQTPLAGPTITVYSVTTSVPTSSSSVLMPNAPPCCMAVSPDGTLLFAAQTNLCTAVGVFNLSGGNISYNKDIAVGTSPSAIAFLNGNVYIANYQSNNVSVINQSSLAVTSTITMPAPNLEPSGFAIVGNIIYVCCQGSNTIVCIDTSKSNATSQITVGDRPFSLMLNQNNSLLYVTNFGTNTVSVINTATNTVVNTITVGNSPSATRITQSGALMFVSNYCDKTLSVVNLTTNTPSVIGTIQLGSTNGNPVDISTFPNNSGYTDVFIAKENFNQRNNSCQGSMTDTNLNMSILSVQESYTPPQARR